MCVIADDNGVLGLGGVMGGETTGVSEATTNVFIESAYFDPVRTARTGRELGIVSDARYRFERGVDPEYIVPGLDLATKLIVDLCGGEPTEIEVAGKVPEGPAPVAFKPRDMKRLTGLDMPVKRMEQILRSLRVFDPSRRPRRSTTRKHDMGDESPLLAPRRRRLCRHRRGTDPHRRLRQAADGAAARAGRPGATRRSSRRCRTACARPAACSPAAHSRPSPGPSCDHEKAALMRSAAPTTFNRRSPSNNPIASDLDYMRPVSMLANLAEAAQRNADHGADDVRLFEAGPVYSGDKPTDQRQMG